MGFLKSVGTVVIYIGFFLAIITFIPGLIPEAEFSEYSIPEPIKDAKNLQLKNRLHGPEVLFSGELKGAECFDSYNGELYTGIHGGYIIKLEENRIVPVVKFGEKCDGIWQEHKCGRPLGLKFNTKGELFVIDTYYGIFKVDVNSKQYRMIVNTSEPIDGKIPRIPNSLDIARNGDIYWTDSSTEFALYDGAYTFLTNPSGRLIRYNAATKKNEVLVKNLGFPNGVKLSTDESFIIVAESLTSRIIKYNLKGPKAGEQEIFSEALPGLPDNIHSDGQGGFLISLIVFSDAEHPVLMQSLMPHPYIRKMFVRLLYVMELPFKLLNNIYPNSCAERLMHSIGSFEGMAMLDTKKTSIVLRMSESGNILDALYSDDKQVHMISSAYIHNGYLWLGSPSIESVMRVPLKQAFPDLAEDIKHFEYSKNQKQVSEPPMTEKKTQTAQAGVKPKSTSVKPVVKATTPEPGRTTTTVKPSTKASTTQKPAATTSTTPKPAASTTAKPTKPASQNTKTTSPPTTAQSSASVRQSATTQKPTSTTVPPPVSKPSPEKVKNDNTKTGNVKSNAKSSASNAKTELPSKVEKATVNTKPDESMKQNVRDIGSEKPKTVEKKSSTTTK